MALCFWAMGEDNRKQNIFGRNNVLLQSTGRMYMKSSREAEQTVVDFTKTGQAHWQPRSWCSLHPCSGADLGFCTQNPSTSGTFGTKAFGNAPCHAATIGMGTPRPLLPVLEIGARLAAGLAPSTPCIAQQLHDARSPTVLHTQYGLNTCTATICLLLPLVQKTKVVPCKDGAHSHAPTLPAPQLARCHRQLHLLWIFCP